MLSKLTSEDLEHGYEYYTVYNHLLNKSLSFEYFKKCRTKVYFIRLYNFWCSLHTTIDIEPYFIYLINNSIKGQQWILLDTFYKFLSVYLVNEPYEIALNRTNKTIMEIKKSLLDEFCHIKDLTNNNNDVLVIFNDEAKKHPQLLQFEFNRTLVEFNVGNISPYCLKPKTFKQLKPLIEPKLIPVLNEQFWELQNDKHK